MSEDGQVRAAARTWLVTGASRGLGRAFAEAALEAGERVAVTARRVGDLAALRERFGDRCITLELDVAERAQAYETVAAVVAQWGRVDVCVNNAGYALAGAVEEVTEQEARRQIDVNFFGPLWVTQAVLPHMRRQSSGHIIQVSSIAAVRAMPATALYCASKWALEGLSESLYHEVKQFGIKVTIVEPGAFRTDWSRDSMHRSREMPAYGSVLGERRKSLATEAAGSRPGDPVRAALLLLEIARDPDSPLRVLMGDAAADAAPAALRARLDELVAWEAKARACDFPPGS